MEISDSEQEFPMYSEDPADKENAGLQHGKWLKKQGRKYTPEEKECDIDSSEGEVDRA